MVLDGDRPYEIEENLAKLAAKQTQSRQCAAEQDPRGRLRNLGGPPTDQEHVFGSIVGVVEHEVELDVVSRQKRRKVTEQVVGITISSFLSTDNIQFHFVFNNANEGERIDHDAVLYHCE